MRDARRELDTIARRFFSKKKRLLFLDFDGTLSPIVNDPGRARMSSAMRAMLRSLSRCCTLIIVSGRSLSDVKRRVRLPGLIYAGNHGFEWEMGGKRHVVALPKGATRALARAGARMRALARAYPRAVVEHKGRSVTLNYRRVPPARRAALIAEALSALSVHDGTLRLRHDAMTIECVPAISWHKGALVRRMRIALGGSGASTLYLGDGKTDEDAFRVLPRSSVRVGKSRMSRARYALASQREVFSFLKRLARGCSVD